MKHNNLIYRQLTHFKTWLLLTLLVISACAQFVHASSANNTISVIPAPNTLIQKEGVFTFTNKTIIHYSKPLENEANYLTASLAPALGAHLKIKELSDTNTQGIILELTSVIKEKDGYQLRVDAQGVHIQANNSTGIFYGVQTLRQLLPVEIFSANKQNINWQLPFVEVYDYPRFQWRGMHLDVGRHFMPVAFVKKFIDQLAIHKMNRFHWHLTEDQGWRIEIKKYPKLTEIGAWRDETMIGHYNDRPNGAWWRPLLFWQDPDNSEHEYDNKSYGGFYSQEEVKDIVAYAQARHIVVVPEIELPGHAQAAIVAYPSLATNNEKIEVKRQWGVSHYIYSPEQETIDFLKDVFVEVMALFPSKYIHVGGDEATKTLWKNSPRVQELIKERGLRDEHEMQSWFIKQFDDFLSENGRRLIGWDEILEGGLAKNATVMSWRGNQGGIAAAQAGHDVIMADNQYTYFDHYQGDPDNEPLAIGGMLPLEKVYFYNPIPHQLNKKEAKHILGGQGQLWTEYIKTPEHVEYMAFPRALALSEVLWLNQDNDKRDFSQFMIRAKKHGKRLDFMNVNYRPFDKK